MAFLVSLLAVQILLPSAQGVPVVSFPYNAQLPPVARTGSLYSYSFPPHTFQSDSNLTYALGAHPTWLSLESEDRRLYGIPDDATLPPGEVVGQTFELIATDGTGSATMQSTIVVSRDDGPSVNIPISEQIKRFGDYSAPSSVLSYPSTDFSYSFNMNTFQHEPGMVNYYASSGDSSPLPAWIKFDAATLSFSGRTPGADDLHQPPQRFDIRLIASDIEGFSSTSIQFSIVVGSHKITTDKPIIELNASRGSILEYDGLADGIRLDGRLIKPGEVDATVASLPGWLSFDVDTWTIKGNPKEDDHSTNFTIRFTDPFSDALEVWAMVNIATGLFETTFTDVEATPGEDFSLDLSSHLRNPDDVEVKLQTNPEQGWLSLTGLEIKGKVPKTAKGEIDILIEARSRVSGIQETEALQMTFLASNGKTTMASSATSTTSKSPRKTENERDDKDASETHTTGISTSIILLATIIPILAVALLIMLLICCLRRRRNRRAKTTRNKLHTKISRPILSSLRINGSAQNAQRLGTADGAESHVLRNEKSRLAATPSNQSSRSSETLGSFTTRETIREYRTHDAGNERHRVAGDGETEAGQSWFTFDRTPTALRSEVSTQSRGSDTTLPMSTHQILPTPPFLSYQGDRTFRGGLELTIPSLAEMPSLYLESDLVDHRNDRLTGFYSTITSSSAALPASRYTSPKMGGAGVTSAASTVPELQKVPEKDNAASEKDWSTIRDGDSGERVPELPLPSHVRLSSQQWLAGQKTEGSWLEQETLSGLRSLMTETSFGSSENWRVIGRHNRNAPSPSTTYRDLVKTAPFNPSVPTEMPEEKIENTTGQSKGSSSSSQSGNLSSWVRPKASRSRFSRLNADEKTEGGPPNWRRDDSGKASEGSYTAFL